jgi:hypothetical protein
VDLTNLHLLILPEGITINYTLLNLNSMLMIHKLEKSALNPS